MNVRSGPPPTIAPSPAALNSFAQRPVAPRLGRVESSRATAFDDDGIDPELLLRGADVGRVSRRGTAWGTRRGDIAPRGRRSEEVRRDEGDELGLGREAHLTRYLCSALEHDHRGPPRMLKREGVFGDSSMSS